MYTFFKMYKIFYIFIPKYIFRYVVGSRNTEEAVYAVIIKASKTRLKEERVKLILPGSEF